VGDQQASLFGAGLTSDKLVVNIGTGGQVAGLQGQFETDGNYQIRPYFNGEKIRTITHLPSGRALKSFVEFVFGENASDSDYEAFINMAGDANEGRIIEISNFDETIELLKERGSPKDIEGLAGAFFHSLIEIYAKSISTLDLEGDLIFAGGVGQKVRIISTGLSALTSREFYISDTDETTLEGLRLLSESV
jgi:sugar (pentulose or hexulose) kinase